MLLLGVLSHQENVIQAIDFCLRVRSTYVTMLLSKSLAYISLPLPFSFFFLLPFSRSGRQVSEHGDGARAARRSLVLYGRASAENAHGQTLDHVGLGK